MAITGTEERFRNMKMQVEELEVGGNAVTSNPAAANVTVNAPGTDETWTDVQTALTDIAARLAILENEGG